MYIYKIYELIVNIFKLGMLKILKEYCDSAY